MPKFDDERETQPDVALFPCPGCQDGQGQPQGEITVTVWSSDSTHSSHLQKCPVCSGQKEITRDRLSWFRAQPR